MTSTPPNLLKPPSRWRFTGVALLGLGIALTAWAGQQYLALQSTRSALVDVETSNKALHRKLDQRQAGAATTERDAAQSQSARLVPTLSWLEQYWSEDLSYARIDVDRAASTQKLEVEARHVEALLTLVDQLAAVPEIRTVALTRQRKVDDSVEAALQLRWREAQP